MEAALSTLLAKPTDGAIWPSELLEEAAAMIRAREHEREDKMNNYFSEDHMRQFEELRDELGEDFVREIEGGCRALYAEAQSVLDSDPDGPEARELVRKWDEMLEITLNSYESKPGLWKAIGNARSQGAFKDNPNEAPTNVWGFIERVRAANSQPVSTSTIRWGRTRRSAPTRAQQQSLSHPKCM